MRPSPALARAAAEPSRLARQRCPLRPPLPRLGRPRSRVRRQPALACPKLTRSGPAAIPFVLGKEQAEYTLETAAATAFGVGSVTRLLIARFLRKLGIEYELPVRRIAVRPLLLPTWRVDLRMGARGVLGEAEMQFQRELLVELRS